MKANPSRTALAATILLTCIGASANAATMLVSSTAPTTDGADISQFSYTGTLGSSSGNDKFWTDTPNPGQTFTTGSNATGYYLTSFTFQTATVTVTASKSYTIRLGTVSGTTFATVVSQTVASQPSDAAEGDFMTWIFDSPVTLTANTVYGVDVEMETSGAYQDGIPYLFYDSSSATYANGTRYSRGDGDPTDISASNSGDRVFHLDLAAAPIPEPSAALLGGLGALLLLRRRK